MNVDNRPDFDAFISYSHADKESALRIQRFLERCPLPARAGTPRRRLRVFRDDTDIRAAELTAELGAALGRSRALILCASPQAAQSTWVRQELDLFSEQDRTRPILPILVSGDAATAVPSGLAAEIRYADARGAWRFGRLRRKSRDELLRVVATLAGEDLRTFIPWDRRRRRAIIGGWIAAIVVLAVGALFLPFDHPRALGRPAAVASGGTIEFCDVAEDRLVLAARETYGRGSIEEPSYADYVRVYPHTLGQPGRRAWLDDSGYLPATRLLHVGASSRVRGLARDIDIAALRAAALERVKWPDALGDGATDQQALEPGFWAATPAPQLQIALVAIKPAAFDPAAVDGPAQGAAIVAIHDGAAAPATNIVEGLSPPSPGKRPPAPRGVALADGLPIAVTAREVFVGMPMRRDGGAGGLWRWDRATRTWDRVKLRGKSDEGHANVASLAADPGHPGRVFVSTGSGSWSWNARKGEYAAEVFERPSYDAPWQPFTLLPMESRSAVQLCGFRSDATLYARVNQSLFAVGPYNLLRLWLGRP